MLPAFGVTRVVPAPRIILAVMDVSLGAVGTAVYLLAKGYFKRIAAGLAGPLAHS